MKLQSGMGVMGWLTRPYSIPYSIGLPYSYTIPSGTRPTSNLRSKVTELGRFKEVRFFQNSPYFINANTLHQRSKLEFIFMLGTRGLSLYLNDFPADET